MTTATPGHATPDRKLTGLLTAYAFAVLLLVLVSARLWWQAPLRLTAYEFDYFLGMFASADMVLADARVELGRWLHLLGFAVIGGLYLAATRHLLRSSSGMSTRAVAGWSAAVAVLFAVGMPWVSPDVFFYIGTGWVESHYGLSPYLTRMSAVPGYKTEQMFANVFSAFQWGITSYGPLFQKAAAVVAGLSGGSEKLALAIYKLAALALHAGCSALVWRLASPAYKRWALFAYAANPLICFSVLTCAHNDHWMNLFVLLALLALGRRRWLLTGVALGAAFGIKYFPLVFVPVFGLAALVQRREEGGRARNLLDAAMLVVGFVGTIALSYALLYPEALKAFTNVAASGMNIYRNSIYHLINVFTDRMQILWFDRMGFIVSYHNVGRYLLAAYAITYAGLLLGLIGRLRRDAVRGVAEGCLVVTLAYFMLVNACNQEWYLTWLMGFALLLPYERTRSLAWSLSAYFLPLVIFTVKSPEPLQFFSNVLLYCVVLVSGASYLAALVRAMCRREAESIA